MRRRRRSGRRRPSARSARSARNRSARADVLSLEQRRRRMQTSPSLCCWCREPLKRMPTVTGEDWEPWMCWNDTPLDGEDRSCWERQVAFGIRATVLARGTGKGTGNWRWLFAPTPRQAMFAELTRARKYALFGGAKAVTKSYGLRWLLYRDCLRI